MNTTRRRATLVRRAGVTLLVLGCALAVPATGHASTATSTDITRPGPVPPCPDPPVTTPPTTVPTPAGPGDVGSSAGTITTSSMTAGAGCGPETFSVSTTGVGQIQMINDPVPHVGSVVTYTGNVDIDITGASSQQNVNTAVGSASIQVSGSNKPGNVDASAGVDQNVPETISCDLSTGSYVRQAGTLTVTATGTCTTTFKNLQYGWFTVYGHYVTLVLTGSPAVAGDSQVPAAPNAFSDTWVETDFHA